MNCFGTERNLKMITNTTCPLASSCPVMPLLHTILDEVRSLKDKEPKAKKSSKAAHVNGLIIALQIEHPEKLWTSDSFAKKIGCTGAAVRKTKAWKNYQKRLKTERQKHSVPQGYRNKQGNIEAFAPNTGDDG
jgi:hypothetical protein